MSHQESRNEETLNHGCLYDVGINDGTVFRNVEYLGTKLFYGKPIMVFKTACNKVFDQDEITINPSYHSWTIEKGVVEPLVQDDAILEKE